MNATEQIARDILATRDFCGNEREAAKQACADLGLQFTESLYSAARSIANGEWAKCQRAAGVPAKYLVV